MKTMKDFKGTQGEFAFRETGYSVIDGQKIGQIYAIGVSSDMGFNMRSIASLEAKGQRDSLDQFRFSNEETEANAKLFAASKKLLASGLEVLRFKDSISYMASESMVTPDNLLKALIELEQAINESL